MDYFGVSHRGITDISILQRRDNIFDNINDYRNEDHHHNPDGRDYRHFD